MLKAGAVIAFLGIAFIGVLGPQQGCRDVQRSLTRLTYAPTRDMRNSVSLAPNRSIMLIPDSVSVPVQGREYVHDRDVLSATLHNPVAATDSSIARGERKFMRTCVPCHGENMSGNGPVAAHFIPPPDLLNASSRGRTDGFIYSYIRNGGAVMPSYGRQVTIEETWNLVNYIRHMQRTNPR